MSCKFSFCCIANYSENVLPSPSLSIHSLAKVHFKHISVLNILAMCIKTGRWENVRCGCLNCVFSVISSASASCKHQYLKTMQTGRTMQSKPPLTSSNLCLNFWQTNNNLLHVCFFSHHRFQYCPSEDFHPLFWEAASTLLLSSIVLCYEGGQAGRDGGEDWGGDPRLPAAAGGRWDHSRCGCKIMEANWPQQSPSIPFGVYSTGN